MNLITGEGLVDCLRACAPLTAVINCAAISSPAQCESDPETARAINIPSRLIQELHNLAQESALLIHLSTDQVYSGSLERGGYWTEEDTCSPVNQYGLSKFEAEQYIVSNWINYVILRSSIIYGPALPPGGKAVNRALFVQFVDKQLASRKETTFYKDEWRCPIYVYDIVEICRRFAKQAADKRTVRLIFCMGGKERLSRVGMAEIIAQVVGHSTEYIKSISSAEVDRDYNSPPDISMDSSLLEQHLQMALTDFKAGVLESFSNQIKMK